MERYVLIGPPPERMRVPCHPIGAVPIHFDQVNPMFHTPIEPRVGFSSSFDRLLAFGDQPLQFPAAHVDPSAATRVPAAADCDGLRFAAAARKSDSRDAFLPAFANADWRVFASFCVVRHLPAGYRVMIPGRSERTLTLVVRRQPAARNRRNRRIAQKPSLCHSKLLLPGTILGADALFSDAAGDQDVRTLEDSLVLELSLPRQKELTRVLPRDRLRAAARGRCRDRRARAVRASGAGRTRHVLTLAVRTDIHFEGTP